MSTAPRRPLMWVVACATMVLGCVFAPGCLVGPQPQPPLSDGEHRNHPDAGIDSPPVPADSDAGAPSASVDTDASAGEQGGFTSDVDHATPSAVANEPFPWWQWLFGDADASTPDCGHLDAGDDGGSDAGGSGDPADAGD